MPKQKLQLLMNTHKVLLYGTICILIIQGIFLYRFINDGFHIGVYITSFVMPFTFCSLLFLFKGLEKISTYITVVSATIITILLIWSFGGYNAPGPQWLSLTPILIGGFFGRKSLWISVLVSLSVFFAFYFIPSPILLDADTYFLEKKLNIYLMTFFVTVVVYAFLSSMEKYQRSLEKEVEKNNKLVRVLLHDISNPLTVIKFIHKRLEGVVEKKDFAKLKANTEVIEKIIEEVKTFTNIESGKESVYKEVIKASSVLKEVDLVFDDMAKRKGVNLQLENFFEDSTHIYTNFGLLQSQILYNLISNAIKFTPKNGSVVVRGNIVGKNVIFEVADQGHGLSKDQLKSVETGLSQVSTIGTGGEVGSGHGLSLVKYFLDKLEGQLELLTSENEYSIDKGTLVRVILPLHLTK